MASGSPKQRLPPSDQAKSLGLLEDIARAVAENSSGSEAATKDNSLDSVFGFARLNRLPLHVRWRIRTVALQRDHMVYDIARTATGAAPSGRTVALSLEFVLRCRTPPDAPTRITRDRDMRVRRRIPSAIPRSAPGARAENWQQ
ncbi:MAG TPA: hypothetical protein VGM27_26115 [Acidobacteriaceae bacterium]